LVLAISIAGFVWSPEDIQGEVQEQIASQVGPQGAEAVRTMLEGAREPGRGMTQTIIGIVALLFGATAALVQLQTALDRTWDVEPDPDKGGLRTFLMKRLFSLLMIVVIAFLLLLSLLLTAVMSRIGPQMEQWIPIGIPAEVYLAINEIVAFLVVVLLFAAMFKVLPDADIAWKDVWTGAFVTAVLFAIGRFVLGFYLGRMEMGAYGAAAAMIFLLLWIYYSAIIFLVGAEFTQVWARRHGATIGPAAGAVGVKFEKEYIRHDASGPRAAPG
jgi:membrane protein